MRFRRLLVVSIMVGSLVAGSAGTALAAEATPGPGFGKHVSEMVPEHPRDHGRTFGECVSAMARGGVCDHTHPAA
jgi:hypothetical protein